MFFIRKLLSIYNLACQQLTDVQVPAIWVVCDRQDKESTAYMSSHVTYKTDSKSYAIRSFNVTITGILLFVYCNCRQLLSYITSLGC